ncbi:MAG: outer membrane protein assembly factor BamA [Candidatus Omnitrophota bacterium]|nr:outer membrane protein assembly factor BamA [Candidatus Omnitrophota bacterium]
MLIWKGYKMIKLFKVVSAVFLFVSLAQFSIVGISYSEDQNNEGKIIKTIAVKNNRAISAETILSKIKTKVGDEFNQVVINEDLKRLYATEYFTDVSIDAESYEDGLNLTLVVEEKTVIGKIDFKGNKAYTAQRLKQAMKSRPDDMLNMSMLAQDIAEIRSLYVKKGFPQVEVKYELDVDKELNKTNVIIIVDERKKIKVSKIEITGNEHLKSANIVKILGTKPSWLFNPGIFKEDVLEEDVDKIRALYDNIGYLDAEVVPKLDYSEDGTQLFVTFDVKEGKQYLVGSINIAGNTVLPEKEIRSKIKMKVGKSFSRRELRDDMLAIRDLYYMHGYMDAVVDVDQNVNPATGGMDMTYTIDPKEVVYVGKVIVRGNTKTREIIIRRELRIYPGDKFNGAKIKRSKERLYNLGLFEDVSFDTEPTLVPQVHNLTVNVKETKTGEFSFGGGYSSVDQFLGFVEIGQKNFDILNFPTFTGGGQQLVVRAEIGMVRQNYNIGWVDPWIFGWPYLFGFDLYRTSHTRQIDVGWAYDETKTGGDLKIGKELTENLRADALYRLEYIKIGSVPDYASQDFKDEEGSKVISAGSLQLTQDTRDNIYNPGHGYILNGTVEDAGGVFMGDKEYVKGTATAAYYSTFFEKFVVELKARGGWSAPYGRSKSVPIYERFFAGGANTIRGYKERKVGPRDKGSDEPIGGEALLIGNVELTFPIYEKILKGAIFYDVGNVWTKAGDFMTGGNYKSGAGIGIRVNTPVGPFRLDWGYPLTKNQNDTKEGEFYFSISRGF